VAQSYARHQEIELIDWPANSMGARVEPGAWPESATSPAAVVIQTPNFWGFVERNAELVGEAKKRGALVIAVVNPMSLSALEPPGAWGADIVVGESQPIGLPMNFGGPYAGFMATRQEHIRRMPGRIVGRTVDAAGREGFTLTLQTREQHIRREKATSNICTNQGLCATMVTLWLSLIGKNGFEQLGDVNVERAGQLMDGLKRIPGVEMMCKAPFFNEFTVRLPISAEMFYTRMRDRGILPGLPASRLGGGDDKLLIICATETKTAQDIEKYLSRAREALAG
jgi:glycine dehydrogenase subunit 1